MGKVKAFICSVGEPTTEISAWSLERLGFEVIVLEDSTTSLWQKMKTILETVDYEDYLRLDADVICNKKVLDLIERKTEAWYIQCYSWDWLKQDLCSATPSFVKKEALQTLRTHIDEAEALDRPETYLTRLPEFYNPRRHETANLICGLHGFRQNDYDRVKRQKDRRKYDYDWELFDRIQAL